MSSAPRRCGGAADSADIVRAMTNLSTLHAAALKYIDASILPEPKPAPMLRADGLVFQASHWDIDPALTFLNHGSYGAVPRRVLDAQSRLRQRMERDAVRFYKVDLEHLMDGVREVLGAFVHCDPAGIGPVPNATMGIATVLANTPLQPGDEILITDHEYMSGINELQRIASKTGARVVSARIPFPVQSAAEIESAVMQAVSPRTKLAMISHITSTTSLIFPVESIVPKLKALGIDVLVDGAHSPGQIPLDLAALDPTYFVGSLHKWISAPKGTAFLYVAKHKREGFRPVFLSSRGHKIRPDRALFLRDFDYHGTLDYSGFLVVPEAIAYLGRLLPGGWPELIDRNHELALKGRAIVCNAIGANPAAPDSMIGCMASIVLPEAAPEMQSRTTIYDDPLQDNLVHKHGVVTPIWRLASTNQRVVRLSAQAYNTVDQYEKLAEALVTELKAEGALKSTARRAG